MEGKRLRSLLMIIMAVVMVIGGTVVTPEKVCASQYNGKINGKTFSQLKIPTNGSNPYCGCGIKVSSTAKNHVCCVQYAKGAYKLIWGNDLAINAANNMLKSVSKENRKFTINNLKNFFGKAQIGAYFRIDRGNGDGWGHSMIFVGLNSSNDGAYFIEGNYDGTGRSRVHEWKWSTLVNHYSIQYANYQYINCIVWPGGGNGNVPSTIANSTIKQIPSTIKQGSAWTCDGTVSSNYKLKYVNGYIIKNTGKNSMWNDETKVFTVSGSDLKSGSKTYNLKNSAIDKGLLFNMLEAGNYYYVITARDETDAPLQVIQKFSITANNADTIAPTISNAKITNYDSKNVTIECDITDNVKVATAQITVWKDGEVGAKTAKWYNPVSVNGNHYVFKWSVENFGNYIGKYKTNIHAWDTSNNKKMYDNAKDSNFIYTPVEKTNTKPSGVVDSVVCDTSGKIHVQGWAYDPDSKGTALDIHVYVGGPASPDVPCAVIKANLERKDVNKAFGCGDYHGFNAQISTDKLGSVPVYIYAIDTAGGNNPELGNRTVSVETEKPIGVFEKVESVSANKIHVAGWAYDPDTKDKAVTISVYIGGQCNVAGVEKHEITANITRDDINASKNCGSKHGFDAVITTQKRGVQAVYVWAHNTDGSPSNINTFLGNTDVNIHDCNEVIDQAVAATYETTGLTEGSHCSVCGKVIVAQEIIPKIVKDSSDDMKEPEDDNKFYDDKEKTTYDEGIDIDKEKLIYGDEYDDIGKEKQNLINNSSTTGKEDVSPQNVENDKKSLVDSSISQKNNNKAETDSSKSLGDKTSQSNVSSDDKTNTSRNVENEEEDEDDEFVIGNASYEIIAGNRVMLTSVKDEKLQSFNVPNTVTFNLKKYSVVCVFDEAFMNCKSLKKIVIGKNIEEIGDYAFKNCSSLKNITIKTTKLTKSSFGKKAFKGINKKVTFKCPKKQFKNYKKWIKKAGVPKTAKYKK